MRGLLAVGSAVAISPITRVAELLQNLSKQIETDGSLSISVQRNIARFSRFGTRNAGARGRAPIRNPKKKKCASLEKGPLEVGTVPHGGVRRKRHPGSVSLENRLKSLCTNRAMTSGRMDPIDPA